MSVIMSVMKKSLGSAQSTLAERSGTLPVMFTVRDMNRNTATVLAACRQHGRVTIRHRSGEQFAITLIKEELSAATPWGAKERSRQAQERMEKHRQRMRELGVRGPTTPDGIEHLSRIIAGEL